MRLCAQRMWVGMPTNWCLVNTLAAMLLKSRLAELGVEFESEATLNDAFARFKDLADKKHDIFDEDLASA